MKRKALSTENRPRSLSLTFHAIVWLMLDRFDAPSWVWGMVGTLAALMFLFSLLDFFTAKDVEL